MQQKTYLKWYNKIGYGSGDVAGNVVYTLLSSFVMIYLTDTVGLNSGIVGTLMAVSKIFDGITDIFFGTMIDKTNTKMGKARPWMLWPYIGNCICLVAIFAIPMEWGDTAQYLFFFLAYTMLNAVFYTANNIAYGALTALITKNDNERVQMGSLRFIFAFATSLIIQGVTVQLVDALGGGAEGWKWVAVIYAFVGLLSNTIACFSVKELPPEVLDDTDDKDLQVKEEKYTMLEGAKLLFTNKYYLMICGIYLLTQICQSTLNMGVYFMKYILGDAELLGTFSLAMNIPLIMGLIVTPILVKKMGEMYKLNIIGYIVAVLGRFGVMVAAYMGNIPLMLIFTGVGALGTSPLQGGLNALIASCSEYTFLTKGKRIDGTMYSCSSFGIKVGGSIGTAISGWLMALAGFVENAAVQTSSTIGMLHFLYLWAPIIINLIVTIVLCRLNVEKANEKIMAERV
mgnify:CR=1 FL=1